MKPILNRDNEYYGYDCLKFVGIVVECDADQLRARVRVFGIHNIEDTVKVSDGDLPWAIIAYPVDSSSPHTLEIGSWVHGFFMDGRNAQMPIIEGVFGRGFSGVANGSDRFTHRPIGGIEYGQPEVDGNADSGGAAIPTDTSTINIPGGSNPEKVYNYIYNKLVSEGLSANPRMHTAAAVGVLMVESGPKLDHTIVNPSSGAYGLAQWLSSNRIRGLRDRYGQHPTLAQQLDYMWYELNNEEREAKRRWLSADNLEDAVVGFEWYERNEAQIKGTRLINRNHRNVRRALKFAQQVYNTMSPQAFEAADTPSNPARYFRGA